MFRLAAHITADFFSICAVQRSPSPNFSIYVQCNGYPRRLFQYMCRATVTLADFSVYVQCNGHPPWNSVPNKERRPKEKRPREKRQARSLEDYRHRIWKALARLMTQTSPARAASSVSLAILASPTSLAGISSLATLPSIALEGARSRAGSISSIAEEILRETDFGAVGILERLAADEGHAKHSGLHYPAVPIKAFDFQDDLAAIARSLNL